LNIKTRNAWSHFRGTATRAQDDVAIDPSHIPVATHGSPERRILNMLAKYTAKMSAAPVRLVDVTFPNFNNPSRSNIRVNQEPKNNRKRWGYWVGLESKIRSTHKTRALASVLDKGFKDMSYPYAVELINERKLISRRVKDRDPITQS
jgi:hypothetical protein